MPLYRYRRIPRPRRLVCALWFRRPGGCGREWSSTDVSRHKNDSYGTQGPTVGCNCSGQIRPAYPPCVLAGRLAFFFTRAHRARAAFVASSFLSCGVRAAMRAFPPLPPAAFPPFLPISRITLEIRSRLIRSSYEEWILLATFGY